MDNRQRRLNWDDDEKNLFRLVLKDYVKIIENKATNTSALKLKNKAWEAVYRRFNHLNRRHRLLYQLKTQWKRMKISARRRQIIKKEKHETGDGATVATPATFDDEVVKDLLNPANLSGDLNKYVDQNKYDSDCNDSEPITCLITLDEDITQPNEDIAVPSSTKKVSVNKRITRDDIGEKYLYNKEGRIANSSSCSCMADHSIMLKDEEHRRRMEMAEEEHIIKIGILKERLKSATLEREILELKKKREQNFFSDYVC